jgi:hypothetical protein
MSACFAVSPTLRRCDSVCVNRALFAGNCPFAVRTGVVSVCVIRTLFAGNGLLSDVASSCLRKAGGGRAGWPSFCFFGGQFEVSGGGGRSSASRRRLRAPGAFRHVEDRVSHKGELEREVTYASFVSLAMRAGIG